MSIYFIIMCIALGVLIGSMGEYNVPIFLPMIAFCVMVFGGIAGLALILSDGSHSVSIVSGAILAPLIVLGSGWMFAKFGDAHEKSLSTTGRPAMSKCGVIVEAVEPRKAGLIELDEAIESGKVFPAMSKSSIPVGSRAMVWDLRRKALIVVPVKS